MDALQTLAIELLISLQIYFPAANAAALKSLRVETINPAELQNRVCGAPCQVWAWYSPDGVIYIDARLDTARNTLARSIIVHEIVHHAQHIAHGHAADCADWIGRERQAFAVQSAWLRSQGVRPPSFVQRVNSMRCLERPRLRNPNAGLGG
ncbi:MAG: DUF6647 family protein [Hyphomicrobiales bacterium]|nr:DUF6647 family protein [Hyphomicrobiales bacterium]